MYKNMVSCGQKGIFIPLDDFKKGLWLEEEQKLALQGKILENDKLIQSLREDLNILKGEE